MSTTWYDRCKELGFRGCSLTLDIDKRRGAMLCQNVLTFDYKYWY